MSSSTSSSEGSRRPWTLGSFVATLAALFVWASAEQASVDAEHLARRERVLRRFGERPAVFLGDSQIQCAIDDLTDPRLLNLGTGSEHYIFTIQKARLFRPRVAVVGVWIHAFLPYYERLVGRVYLSRYGVWSLTMTESERRDVLARADFETKAFSHLREYVPFLGTQFERSIAPLRAGFGNFFDLPGRAGFVGEEIRAWTSTMTVHRGRLRSSPQARDLKRLVDHLADRRIPVVLLSTPVQPQLREAIPPMAQDEFRQILASLGKAPAVRVWDDSALPLPEGSYRDSNHLSGDGAREYTRQLVARLETEGLLEPLSHPENAEAGLGERRVQGR